MPNPKESMLVLDPRCIEFFKILPSKECGELIKAIVKYYYEGTDLPSNSNMDKLSVYFFNLMKSDIDELTPFTIYRKEIEHLLIRHQMRQNIFGIDEFTIPSTHSLSDEEIFWYQVDTDNQI